MSRKHELPNPCWIDANQWYAIEESYGLHSNEGDTHLVALPACERPWFECIIAAVVAVNAVVMALELDLTEKDTALRDRSVWVALDVFFCVVYTGEIFFRIYQLGFRVFVSQLRYWMDIGLVVLNVADTTIQLTSGIETGLQGFSALRTLRLFRVFRLLRLVAHVKELSLIATGLVSALKSLQWVCTMLVMFIFVMAVMFKILVGRECNSSVFKESFSHHFPGDDPVTKCEEFWGNITRSMYTLYQITTLESWSQVIARPIYDAKPFYLVLIVAFQLLTTFGLMNIVVAAVVDATMNSHDELVLEHQNRKLNTQYLTVLRDIFQQAASANNGSVTPENLIPVLRDGATRRKLLLLDIEYDDPTQLFRIVDPDGNGSCDLTDFTQGFMRMRGNAKAKDLLAIRAQLYRGHRTILDKLETLELNGLSGRGPERKVSPFVREMSPPSPKFQRASQAIGFEDPELSFSSRFSPGENTAGFEKLENEMRMQMTRLSEEFQGHLGNFGRLLGEKLYVQIIGVEERLVAAMPLMQATVQAPGAFDPPQTHRYGAFSHADPSGFAALDRGPQVVHRAGGRWDAPSVPHEEALPAGPLTECCGLTMSGSGAHALPKSLPREPQQQGPGASARGGRWAPVRMMGASAPVQASVLADGGQLASVLEADHKALLRHLVGMHERVVNMLTGGQVGPDAKLQEEVLSRDPLSRSVQSASRDPLTELKALRTEWEKQQQQKQKVSVATVFTQTMPPDNAAQAVIDPGRSGAPEQVVDANVRASRSLTNVAADCMNNFAKMYNGRSSQGQDSTVDASWHVRLERFIDGPAGESLCALIITFNAIVLIFEAQYNGIDEAYKLNFTGSRQDAITTWPGAKEAFEVLETIFGLIFVCELLVKMALLRRRFIRHFWNWLDVLIVGSWCLDVVFNIDTQLNPLMLRLFRLVKLLRIAKLLKTFEAVDSLSILLVSIKASGAVAMWSFFILFNIMTVGALFFCQALMGHISGESGASVEDRTLVYTYFGSFTRSFISMMEITLGNWVPVCRVLTEHVNEWWAAAVAMYVICVSFAILRVISAVFIFETQKAATSDEGLLILHQERQMARQRLHFHSVFQEIDDSHDGYVNMEEFNDLLHDRRVLTWLAALDLDIEQCDGLFILLDNGDGKISFQEFVAGIQRLKGPAKSVDLINIKNQQTAMLKTMKRLSDIVEGKPVSKLQGGGSTLSLP